MDYSKILEALNKCIASDGMDFYHTSTGCVDVIGVWIDGADVVLYNSEEHSASTEGDVIAIVKNELKNKIEYLSEAYSYVDYGINMNKYLYTQCPVCEEDYDSSFNEILSLGDIRCICGNIYTTKDCIKDTHEAIDDDSINIQYKSFYEFSKKCEYMEYGSDGFGGMESTCRNEINIEKGCGWGRCKQKNCPLLKGEPK